MDIWHKTVTYIIYSFLVTGECKKLTRLNMKKAFHYFV